jgi:hypothetical protein
VNPINDLDASRRAVLTRSIGLAIDALHARPLHGPSRRSRRFSASVSYDDRRWNLSATSVRAPSTGGDLTISSDARGMRIEIRPYQRAERTPLVQISGLRPAGLPAPFPDRDEIVDELERWSRWAAIPTDPMRYERRSRMSTLIGCAMHAEGLTEARVGRPLAILPGPWHDGAMGVDVFKNVKLTPPEFEKLRTFVKRNPDVVAQALDGESTIEIGCEYKEFKSDLRAIFDLTAPRRLAISIHEPIDAMRRLARLAA